MRISYDDGFLFTVGEDACLYTFKIMDKEGRGLKAKDITYAEEILITKSDLEEKVRRKLSKNYFGNCKKTDYVAPITFNLIPKDHSPYSCFPLPWQ